VSGNNEKSTESLQCFFAPAGIEMLNLRNDSRKVVKFIEDNRWVKLLLEKIIEIIIKASIHTVFMLVESISVNMPISLSCSVLA
jgi:hypothetical protein